MTLSATAATRYADPALLRDARRDGAADSRAACVSGVSSPGWSAAMTLTRSTRG